jgi:conjugative transfer region protein TrbK
MDGKILARIGAIFFVTFAVTATAIELARKDEPPIYRSIAVPAEAAADPLKAELRRCQRLGEAGTSDSGCLQTWAENRDRFLGPSQPTPQAPGPQGTPQNPPVTRDPVVKEPVPAIDTHSNEAR